MGETPPFPPNNADVVGSGEDGMREALGRDMASTVVVTGAGSGIGRAAALRQAGAGHQVAAVDVVGELLSSLSGHENISTFKCDVSDAKAVQQTADDVIEHFGIPDRLINAAATCTPGRIGELPTACFRREIEVNYLGTVHCVDAILPAMRDRGRGEIVTFSSVAGWLPAPGIGAYIPTKTAVIGFSEVLAAETRGTGVRVICVCPPLVDTPMLHQVTANTTVVSSRAARLVRPLTPETVIDAMERGLRKNRLFVFPGPATGTLVRMRRHAPRLTEKLVRLSGLAS